MISGWLVALSIAVTPGQCATCGPAGGGMAFSPGMTTGSWSAGMGGFGNPYDAVSMGGGGGGDQLYPLDSAEPWLHGYFQEIPAYGGYTLFRPHNYKNVLAQMDVAAGWGISPVMPYSHQWYHRYRQRAGMHPNFGTPYAASEASGYGDVAASDLPAPSSSDQYFRTDHQERSLIQAAAMDRGYSGTPIPGISVPDYQVARVPEGRSAIGDEYLSRIDQMQQVIDQQHYQMQVLQQQLQNSAAGLPTQQSTAQAQHQNGQAYAASVAYPQYGYQELPPPPAGQQQPGFLNPSPSGVAQMPQMPQPQQQPFAPPSYGSYGQLNSLQPSPNAASGQYNNSNANGYLPVDQYRPLQSPPQYGQPALMPGTLPQTAPYNAVQPGPNLQAPAGGQTWLNSQPADAGRVGYFTPNQSPIPGQQAVWQQPAPQTGLVPMNQPTASTSQAYGHVYGYGASPSGIASQQLGYPSGNSVPQLTPQNSTGNVYAQGFAYPR
ncbi:hypothetical protein GC176_13305 [bacterium]|nr:hypothetical protein [bacterium]